MERPRVHTGLEGRVAIVTGANHGIGAAAARALANERVRVLISYLALGDGLEQHARDASEVLARIRDAGGEAVAMEADLRDPATPERLFDAAEAAFGPVQILINNATGWPGRDSFRPSAEARGVSSAGMTQALEVDGRGSALMIAELARRHVARGANWGRIIGMTSGGQLGFPGEVSYGAAKAALENVAMSAAAELSQYGITSNVVHPPITDTGWLTPDVRQFASERRMRIVSPEAVAEVLVLLASDAAGLITGNVVSLR